MAITHATDDTFEQLDTERLSTLTLSAGALAVGLRLSDFDLRAIDVRVASLRRGSGKVADIGADPTLHNGDTLVLSGRPEALAMAEEKLLQG